MKISCPRCTHLDSIKKDGHYFRAEDSHHIQRYRCTHCGKRFSQATLSFEYRQKKRRINAPLLRLLCSKVSIRRAAILLNVDKNTVLKRFYYLSSKYAFLNEQYLKKFYQQQAAVEIQFDDLITKEQTKLKPLSVTTVVDKKTRKIIGMRVSRIPAFGRLAEVGRKKYGKRQNEFAQNADELFAQIKRFIDKGAIIESDKSQFYPPLVNKHFPHATWHQYEGQKACVVGQGELKKGGRDPLFQINHTLAMLRDNISRLLRRSWCLSQKAEMLQMHLNCLQYFYNTRLVA